MINFRILQPNNDDQRSLEVLLKLPFTHSEKKEVLNYLEEICLRDNTPITKIIDILPKDKEVSTPQLIKAIRQTLHKLRYPHLADKEQNYQDWKKQFKLPPGITLSHSPNFEQDWQEIKLRFNNKPDLASKLEKLKQIYNNLEHE